jgi:phosphatidylinositol glycan class B
MSSWFLFYCLPRTYSNCLETMLLMAMFLNWSTSRDDRNVRQKHSYLLRAWILAALACLVRPTAAAIAVPLIIIDIMRLQSMSLISFVILIGVIAIGVGALIDTFAYGLIERDAMLATAATGLRWHTSLWSFFNVMHAYELVFRLN